MLQADTNSTLHKFDFTAARNHLKLPFYGQNCTLKTQPLTEKNVLNSILF